MQERTAQLQQASPKEAPDILSNIINEIILSRDDKFQAEQANAIIAQKEAELEIAEPALRSEVGKKKGAVVAQIKRPSQIVQAFGELAEPEEPQVVPAKALPQQLEEDIAFVEASDLQDIVAMTVPRLKSVLIQKSKEGVLPITKAEINKLKKQELIGLIEALKSGQFQASAVAQRVVPSPAKKEKASAKKSKAAAAAQSIFIQREFDPTMDTKTFESLDYADKRSILEDGVDTFESFLEPAIYTEYKGVLARNNPQEEANMVELYRILRAELGFKGEGMKGKSKRITFGAGLAKPRMMVKPDNIDLELGIKKEASYIPIGKYVVNKHKLRDNVLLMRTVKGGQIAELPQMSISPKLGKMLNNIINGRGFPGHDDLANLEDSDKDIMYKVFKMSKAEGIEAIPRPNKTKDEAEFNRFTILKGQILAGNNSKEMIKEFKTLLIKLIHGGKILRKDGHDILLDLAALGF